MFTKRTAPILFVLAALCALPGAAQVTPSCTFPAFTFTATGAQAYITNTAPTRPCVAWRITYTTTGFSAATVKFQTSPDHTSWTDVPNSICSSSVQPPCISEGANPITSGKTGSVAIRAYDAYVRVNVTSVSGSGTGSIVVIGYIGTTAGAYPQGTTSGGGGGAILDGPALALNADPGPGVVGPGEIWYPFGVTGPPNDQFDPPAPPDPSTSNFTLVPRSGTLRAFQVITRGSPQPIDGGLTLTVNINGVDTALSINIAAGEAAGLKTDLVHTITVSQGDWICVHCFNHSASNSIWSFFWTLVLD